MPCSDEDKIVYNIKELPEVFNVEPVDLFVVETLAGTSIVSFENINFDISQTSFEETFNGHTTDISDLDTRVTVLESIALTGDEGETAFDTIAGDVITKIYPVGSIYITLNGTNPASILNVGTWTQVCQGRMLAGVGTGNDGESNFTVSTGNSPNGSGEYNVTLTEQQLAAHKHFIATDGSTGTRILNVDNQLEHYYNYLEDGSDQPTNPNFEYALHGADNAANRGLTSPTGNNQPHNNVPPHFGVYIWQRTA